MNTTLAENPGRKYNRNQRKRLEQRQAVRHLTHMARQKRVHDGIDQAVAEGGQWEAPAQQTVIWIGSRDLAQRLGKSQTWVKEHAEELGGRKNRLRRWEFPVWDEEQ